MTVTVAAETRISHSVARVSAAPAVVPRSLSCQVPDTQCHTGPMPLLPLPIESDPTGLSRDSGGVVEVLGTASAKVVAAVPVGLVAFLQYLRFLRAGFAMGGG